MMMMMMNSHKVSEAPVGRLRRCLLALFLLCSLKGKRLHWRWGSDTSNFSRCILTFVRLMFTHRPLRSLLPLLVPAALPCVGRRKVSVPRFCVQKTAGGSTFA